MYNETVHPCYASKEHMSFDVNVDKSEILSRLNQIDKLARELRSLSHEMFDFLTVSESETNQEG